MIKILQYGEGNFLRAFADVYFHTLNEEGGNYGVYAIKPTPSNRSAMLNLFETQNNKYHVVLRGTENGKTVENVYRVDSIEKMINPFEDHESYLALARDPELKIIVSNTTEAGICYNPNDKIENFANITYPAKLTRFLYERYLSGLDGVYLLPAELIDNNADELKKCVNQYIELWCLPAGFKRWNNEKNFYCNTLVDRIVSGYPRDEETKKHLEDLIGEADGLMSVGEPFGLWAIEKKGNIAEYIKEGIHNVEVVLTDHIEYYKKRKVRVLNGSHTNLVPAGLMLGAETVYDCMTDEKLSSFVEMTLKNEIIPYVSNDITATTSFANSVKDRFLNPFLNHRLLSISLNSIFKWKARVLPSFKDYYSHHGRIAPNLTTGFSYLMALYASLEKTENGYEAKLPCHTLEIKDETVYLEHFAQKKSLHAFMSDESVWGENLTLYDGFYNTVAQNIEKIKNGVCLL
ncbi:MAG: tagaturonate reductase [Ruminococcaceae bacterium]|nr:tagaturonate reductase [Oscillospiraceae bacterium]